MSTVSPLPMYRAGDGANECFHSHGRIWNVIHPIHPTMSLGQKGKEELRSSSSFCLYIRPMLQSSFRCWLTNRSIFLNRIILLYLGPKCMDPDALPYGQSIGLCLPSRTTQSGTVIHTSINLYKEKALKARPLNGSNFHITWEREKKLRSSSSFCLYIRPMLQSSFGCWLTNRSIFLERIIIIYLGPRYQWRDNLPYGQTFRQCYPYFG